MAVYVDPILNHGGSKSFRWPKSCHMYADTLDELHAMAVAIGMRREWFQDRPDLPHYDLVPARRLRAIALGAVQHDRYQLVEFMRRKRGAELTPSLFGEG
jgi:hypothetical protein